MLLGVEASYSPAWPGETMQVKMPTSQGIKYRCRFCSDGSNAYGIRWSLAKVRGKLFPREYFPPGCAHFRHVPCVSGNAG